MIWRTVIRIGFLFPSALLAGVSVDELFEIRTISAVAISPDATQAAYAVTTPNLAADRSLSEVYVGARKLADGSAPAWSPDGTWIAFLRQGQIWRTRTVGGEAEKLTAHSEQVARFAWSPDGRYLAFLAQDPIPKTDPTVFDVDGKPRQRLWFFDIAGRRERALTSGDYSVGGYEQWFPDGFSWSPDSRRLVFSRRPDARAGSHLYADLAMVNIDGGEPAYLVRRDGMDANPRWSPQGDRVGFISTGKIDWVTISRFCMVSLATGEVRTVSDQFDESVKNFAWSGDGSQIFFTAGQGTAEPIFSLTVRDGHVRRITADGGVYSQLSLSADGKRAAFVRQDAQTPQEVYLSRTDEFRPERISRVNLQLESRQFPATAPIRWRSFDGMEIEGMLTKPLNYVPGKRYPLLVIPHGGPHGVIPNSFFPFRQAWLFASRGWAVLMPNFRGSGNYGEQFLRANLGGWGMGDYRDVQAGVDHVIEIGLADPDRLAIEGASYGGYMTAWSITQTQRFRAAVVGCGITDIASFIGSTDVPTRFEDYLGTDPRAWASHSPMEYVDRVRTPTLIWHGDQDPRVPPTQGRELYTALKRNGVPVEFLLYHGEGHDLSGLRHRKDLLEREIAWLDRWTAPRCGRMIGPIVPGAAIGRCGTSLTWKSNGLATVGGWCLRY